MDSASRFLGALWGAVVGDALGVPVEFLDRAHVQLDPVQAMRGYGSHHQPPGTWSDDSSLALATLASLSARRALDEHDLARRFIAWLDDGYMTPRGKVFDVGNTTSAAIARLRRGVEPGLAGGADAASNGNGSLMRILPIALYFGQAPLSELVDRAHRASALTHRHPQSLIACGIYCLIARALMQGAAPAEAYALGAAAADGQYRAEPAFAPELAPFGRLLAGHLGALPEKDIRSSGYVVHTLEASVWSLLTTRSFEEAVLCAVNLGDDTDTTGTVTGGLAGLAYGVERVPAAWRDELARAAELAGWFQSFVKECISPTGTLPPH